MVSHAGTGLLGELADRIGLTAELSEATDGLGSRLAGQNPGRVLVDVVVARDRAWLARAELTSSKHTGMDVRLIYRRDRYLRGGDHIAFLRQGYAAARSTEPNEDNAHQHQDVHTEGGQDRSGTYRSSATSTTSLGVTRRRSGRWPPVRAPRRTCGSAPTGSPTTRT